MNQIPRCDHCEEEFAPEELTVLAPPAGDGELICAQCVRLALSPGEAHDVRLAGKLLSRLK